jgi:hypothetical protein
LKADDSLLLNIDLLPDDTLNASGKVSRANKHRSNHSQSVMEFKQENLQNHQQLKSIVSDCYSLQRENKV